MTEKRMTVEGNPPHLRLNPPTGTDFQPIDLEIPVLIDASDESKFATKALKVLRDSCRTQDRSCDGNISWSTSGKLDLDDIFAKPTNERLVQGAKVICNVAICPLKGDDGGGSGDRSPVLPRPPYLVETAVAIETGN